MAGALIVIALSLRHFTDLTPDLDFWWFAWARAFQMAALPFLFLAVTSYSYVGLPPGKSGQASALINVARNLGGSIGVSAYADAARVAGAVPSVAAGRGRLSVLARLRAHAEIGGGGLRPPRNLDGRRAASGDRLDRAGLGESGPAHVLCRRLRLSVLVRAAARPGRLSAAARQPRRLASCAGLALNAEPLGQSARASANAEAKRSRPGAQGSGRTIRQPSAPSRIS